MQYADIDGFIEGVDKIIFDSGELGSAQTTVNITGLNGDADEEYELISRIVAGSASSTVYYQRFNSDTATNYGSQYIKGTAAAGTANRGTTDTGFITAATTGLGNLSLSKSKIYNKTGNERSGLILSAEDITGTTVDTTRQRGTSWDNTGDNITSIEITADQANGIGVGSRFILIKKVKHTTSMTYGQMEVDGDIKGAWQKVHETVVSGGAVTNVNITGLTGNTDQLYKLLIRGKNAFSGGMNIFVRPNNDTGANYGHQTLSGSGATPAAVRLTALNEIFSNLFGALNDTSLTEILLYAKSGYERVALSTTNAGVSGTTVDSIVLRGSSWDNTGDEITSLNIVAEQTSGLGNDTTIELYKLNI